MEEGYVSEIVYKVPGNNAGPKGKTYDWKPVKSEDEFLQALEDGWFNTLEEAMNGKTNAPVNNEAPTHKEIVVKAKELKIEFNDNISDKKLLKLIEKKLAEG